MLFAVLASACAGTPTKPVDVAAQERLLLNLRAQNALYVRQIEELQNRVFILENRLESEHAAAEKRGAQELPAPGVVTLSAAPPPRAGSPSTTGDEGAKPGRPAGPAEASIEREDTPEGPYLSVDTPVEYVGDAALGTDGEGGRTTEGGAASRPRLSSAAPEVPPTGLRRARAGTRPAASPAPATTWSSTGATR